METKDMVYGEIKFYSYFSREQNCMVVTDNVDEYITHSERYKMGGNMGIHFPKHDPPFQLDPKS